MFEHIDVILIIFGTIYTIWFYCRLANGKFDAGEINENDVELSEDSFADVHPDFQIIRGDYTNIPAVRE